MTGFEGSEADQAKTGDKRTTVLIVEDHPLFREALARAIDERDDMVSIGEVGSGTEAIAAVRDHHPQVCVLDLGLPDIDGRRVLDQIVSEGNGTRVLVLSGKIDGGTVYSMIEAGASGFEVKTTGPKELIEAIAAVAREELVLPAKLRGELAEQIRARRVSSPSLSDRELEILRDVADGLSAGEIGKKMNLAESTVKTHLTRIYDKLGVSERAAAVAQAIRHGLID